MEFLIDQDLYLVLVTLRNDMRGKINNLQFQTSMLLTRMLIIRAAVCYRQR